MNPNGSSCARAIAQAFIEEPDNTPATQTLIESVYMRASSAMHLRASLSSAGLPDFLPRIFQDFGPGIALRQDELSSASGELMSQSLLVFTKCAGPTVERTLSLLLRAVAAKAKDTDVAAFYERLVLRYGVTEEKDVREAFDRMVDDEIAHMFGD